MNSLPATRRHRQLLFAGLWLLALLLIWGSETSPAARVRVIDSRAATALEPPGSWAVPLAMPEATNRLFGWPFALYGVVMATLLALTGRHMLHRGQSMAAVVVVLMGLALVLPAEQLIFSGLLIGMGASLQPSVGLSRKLWLILMGFLFSLTISREFGFLAIYSLLFLAPEVWNFSTKRSIKIVLGLLLLLVAGLLLSSGFRGTFFRPLSWMWTSFPGEIFPQRLSAFSPGQDWRGQALLVVFFLYCWIALAWTRERRGHVLFLLPLLFLSLLAFGNITYLGLAGLLLAWTFPIGQPSELSPRIGYGVLAMGMVFGIVRFVPQAGSYLDFALGNPTPQQVNPAEWNLAGRVMLLDVGQSQDWQAANLSEKCQLLLDDRWEVFRDQYEHYATVCRDMREIRADSYLRTDSQWGGYKRWLEEWSPQLLVVNSKNLWDVRRLSLSPAWRILGLDSRCAIFGAVSDRQNLQQATVALAMIQQLEWPSIPPRPWQENVIAADTSVDLLQVSRMLNAMRFPYASLRVLPPDGPGVELQRTWSYLEIAHRVWRYSGQASLLDQCRGVERLQQHLAAGELDEKECLQAFLCLKSLGLESLARQLCQQYLPAEANRFEASDPETSSGDAESELRQALNQGNIPEAQSKLKTLPKPSSDYYGLLIEAWEMTSDQLFEKLSALLALPNFPAHLRGEAWFYLGCLAMETGNSESAIGAFRASLETEPDSAFSSLAQFYLRQLGVQ